MKHAFKWLLATTAFVAASAAQAQSSGLVGKGSLTFSPDGSVAAVSAGIGITTPTLVPNISGLSGAGSANTASYDLPSTSLGINFSSWTIQGSSVTSLTASDSFVRLSRAIFDGDNLLGTRRVYLTDIEFNLSQSTLYADLYTSDLNGTLTALGKTAIFQADQAGLVGGNGQTSGSLAGNLRITTVGAARIQAGLGLDIAPDSALGQLWSQANWGTASFALTAVPEPSTYAMAFVGLMVVGAMARRRQA
jgi:hypothetical protein